MKLHRMILFVATMSLRVFASDMYVSPTGDDANPGTLGRPFRTVARALSACAPGDRCVMRGGRYHEAVQLNGLHGRTDASITIEARPGEKVVWDGTVALNLKWRKHRGQIYRAVIDREFWQLFVDERPQVLARWPNARRYEDLFSGDIWASADTEESSLDSLVDSGDGPHRLRDCTVDLQGALVVANVGSWTTWTRRVTGHQPGSDRLRLAALPLLRGKKQKYFLEGGIGLLDTEGEWHIDLVSRLVYFWAAGGQSPSRALRGKVQSYAIDARDCSHIVVRGITFFATTLSFVESNAISVEGCAFRYSTCSRRALGDTTATAAMRLRGRRRVESGDMVLRDCEIMGTDSQAVMMSGDRGLIENCLFERIDYAATGLPGLMCSIYIEGSDSVFRRNTVRTCGASETLQLGPRPLIELNDMSETGFAQSDGAMVQLTIGAQPGSEVRYNWFHDTIKSGARFDAPIPPVRWGHGGSMHHNVIWNTGSGLVVKGEGHRVCHNTCLNTERQGIIVLDDKAEGGGGNRGTMTAANFACGISGHRKKAQRIPGIARFNWNGNDHHETGESLLRGPLHLDFRPKLGSALIDAAQPIEGIDHTVRGKAPDIGAYEHDAPHYWIPGRRQPHASQPVPSDGTAVSRRDIDLMWLRGSDAKSHHVYFGHDRRSVASAGPGSREYQGRWEDGNIFSPESLERGSYYWRVDAVNDNRVIPGPIWTLHIR